MYVIALCAILSIAALIGLAHKWEIEKRVAVPAAAVIGISAGAIVFGLHTLAALGRLQTVLVQITMTVLITLGAIAWRFYRNPERNASVHANVILSPADGRVIYIKRIEENEVPFSEKRGTRIPLCDFIRQDIKIKSGFLVGIAMSLIDVHVNRSPIDGRIEVLKHIDGHFFSLKREESILQNERALTVIDNGSFRVAVLQIASRMVRKIMMFVIPGQEIKSGERMGMILFGSQVDVVIPDLSSLRIETGIGAKVKAGLSVLASFR